MLDVKQKKDVQTYVRLSKSLIKDIDRIASKENCTRSEAIRGLIKLALVHYGNQK